VRLTRTSVRTGVIAVAAGTLAAGTLLIAPSTQAAPAAASPASATVLSGVVQTLDKSARIAGTAWAVDSATHQVVVSLDQSVTGT
jgi:streptogrisin B